MFWAPTRSRTSCHQSGTHPASFAGTPCLKSGQPPASRHAKSCHEKGGHKAGIKETSCLFRPTSCRSFGCHNAKKQQHSAFGLETSCLKRTQPPVSWDGTFCLLLATTACPCAHRTPCLFLPSLPTPLPCLSPAPLGQVIWNQGPADAGDRCD
jgi:hypothetical protein